MKNEIKKTKSIKLQIILWIITSLIALSGWGTLLYQHIENSPKIEGSILFVLKGQLSEPEEMTVFLIYPYLTNMRKGEVHILDYELEVDFGNGFEKLNRFYGVDNVENWFFFDSQNREITIPNLKDQLIYKKDTLAKFGTPLHGFILFGGEPSLLNKEVKEYRLTCIDAFGKKHVIISRPQDIKGLYWVMDETGMKIGK